MSRNYNQNWPVSRIDMAGVGVCVLAAGLAYGTIVRPILNAKIDERMMAMSLASDTAEIERTRASIAESERQADDVRRRIEQADVQLHSTDQLNIRLGELSELARQSGLTVQTMRPKPVVVGPRFTVTPIELKGTGGYRAVDALISAMHRSMRDLRVVGLEIEAQRTPAVAGSISTAENESTAGAFSIEVSWYSDSAGAKRAASANRP